MSITDQNGSAPVASGSKVENGDHITEGQPPNRELSNWSEELTK